MIYSGDYGELIKKDNLGLDSLIIDEYKGFINTEDWNRPEILIIFTTSSIIYGLSYDERETHKVYGYYFNNSPLNSNDCNQQINRIRFPISFNLYIERTTVNPF